MPIQLVQKSEVKCTHCGCEYFLKTGWAHHCAECKKYFPKTLIKSEEKEDGKQKDYS